MKPITFADFLITKERDNQAHEDTFKPASLRKQWDSTDDSSRLAGHSLVRKQQQTAFNQATGDFSHTACDINGPGGTNSLDCVDEFLWSKKVDSTSQGNKLFGIYFVRKHIFLKIHAHVYNIYIYISLHPLCIPVLLCCCCCCCCCCGCCCCCCCWSSQGVNGMG